MLTLDFTPAGEPPWARSGREVQTWRDASGRATVRAFVGPSGRWIDFADLGVFAFAPDTPRVSVWPAAGADPAAIRTQFDRFLQPVILQALGRQTLHAGAVLGSDGVLACCGRPGAGKSTVSYALATRGWLHVADDTLVLGVRPNGIVTHPLPFTPRFREASYQFFGGERTRFSPAGRAPRAEAGLLRCVFILRQDRECHIPSAVPVRPAIAFSELLTHACTFDASSRDEVRRLTEDYLTMAQVVPVLAVTYRADLHRITELLDLIETTARAVGVSPPVTAAPA